MTLKRHALNEKDTFITQPEFFKENISKSEYTLDLLTPSERSEFVSC